MRRRLLLALLASPVAALAQTYRCDSGGKTVYQQAPCAGTAAPGAGRAPLSDSERAALTRAADARREIEARRRDEILKSFLASREEPAEQRPQPDYCDKPGCANVSRRRGSYSSRTGRSRRRRW